MARRAPRVLRAASHRESRRCRPDGALLSEVARVLTTCWSVRGGSGTTVVAAGVALVRAKRHHQAPPVLLVDLGGDAPAVLGMPEPAAPGVADWLNSDAPASALDDLALADRFWDQIPVVLVDGEVHDFYRVDPARLRSALSP